MSVVNNFFVKFAHKVFCRRLNQRTYAKESARVFIGLKKQLFYRFAPHRGYFFRCIRNQERCASFTPVRHGRHIRRVGFKQKPVLRHKRCDLCRLYRIFKCDRSAETYIHTELYNLLCRLHAPRKAVHNSARTVLFKQIQRVLMRFAVVNYNGCLFRSDNRARFHRLPPLFFARQAFLYRRTSRRSTNRDSARGNRRRHR